MDLKEKILNDIEGFYGYPKGESFPLNIYVLESSNISFNEKNYTPHLLKKVLYLINQDTYFPLAEKKVSALIELEKNNLMLLTYRINYGNSEPYALIAPNLDSLRLALIEKKQMFDNLIDEPNYFSYDENLAYLEKITLNDTMLDTLHIKKSKRKI